MKPMIMISILMCLLAVGFIIVSCDISDDGVKILNDDDYNEIEVSEEYTPSQNLAIIERRFSDAEESIKKMRDLNGNK